MHHIELKLLSPTQQERNLSPPVMGGYTREASPPPPLTFYGGAARNCPVPSSSYPLQFVSPPKPEVCIRPPMPFVSQGSHWHPFISKFYTRSNYQYAFLYSKVLRITYNVAACVYVTVSNVYLCYQPTCRSNFRTHKRIYLPSITEPATRNT